MDKSGTIAKAIVAAPTFDPVREVEYGCGKSSFGFIINKVLMRHSEHLQDMMNIPVAAEKLMNAYVNLQGMLGKPTETQTTKDPKDPKRIPLTTLRPTFLCLQCQTISSPEDRDAHGQARKHQLCEYIDASGRE